MSRAVLGCSRACGWRGQGYWPLDSHALLRLNGRPLGSVGQEVTPGSSAGTSCLIFVGISFLAGLVRADAFERVSRTREMPGCNSPSDEGPVRVACAALMASALASHPQATARRGLRWCS